MNTKQWAVLGVVLALMASTAIILVRVGASQRLGTPGLQVVDEPTLMTNGVVAKAQSVKLPTDLHDFTSEPVGITPLEVSWLPPDTLFGRRQYQAKDGFQALISAVLMGSDRTSIHKPQFCLDGQGWRIEKTETVTIPMSRPHPYELKVMKLTSSRAWVHEGRREQIRGVYVYWFVAENQLTPHHGERMWWMARDLILTGVLQRWAYVTYFAVCRPGQEDATFSRLKELITASVPEFQLAAGPVLPVGATAAISPEGRTNDRN
jgi:hypothetical protein